MLTDKEKEILNHIVEVWSENGSTTGANTSFAEVFVALDKLGLERPKKLIDFIDWSEKQPQEIVKPTYFIYAETGDSNYRKRSVQLIFDDKISLFLDNRKFDTFALNKWKTISDIIHGDQIEDWRAKSLPTMKFLPHVDSTPSYQLVKSLFEIARTFGIERPDGVEENMNYSVGKFLLSHRQEQNDIFFPDLKLLNENEHPEEVDMLVASNKLCRLIYWHKQKENSIYYVPYTTPNWGFAKVSRSAKQLWNKIRTAKGS